MMQGIPIQVVSHHRRELQALKFKAHAFEKE